MSSTKIQTERPQVEAERPAAPATAPRKRRRRAPTTGAADDCFACQDRHGKCDRRRPYCTPCLDQGKDCSGYKTALTWGVGVASRGKLRGLSLPVAKSKKAVQSTDDDDNDNDTASTGPRKLAKLGPTRRASDSSGGAGSIRTPGSHTTNNGHFTPTTYGFVNMDPASASSSTASPMLPPPSQEWHADASMSQGGAPSHHRKKPRRHTLQPLQVPAMHPARDYGVMPMTASVVGGYGHHDFGLSSQISPMVPAFTAYGIMSPTYKDFGHQPLVESPHEGTFFSNPEPLGWSRDDFDSSISSDHSSHELLDEQTPFFGQMDSMMATQQSFASQSLAGSSAPDSAALMGDTKFPDFANQPPLVANDVGDHPSLIIPRSLPSLAIGNTPKLRSLIDYYDKVISPVIVAFDGPTNPYRSHILSLAVESETLQHAIAALSASNLRMRRGHNPLSTNRSSQSIADSSHAHSVRKSSIAHSLMEIGMDRLPQTSASEPSGEELYHKGASIKALNKQLADPTRCKDDSILATLLILCLYHICDTGVAKFKTQFAGVKKILALRGGVKGHNSKATNWLTIMFTWFDAMTATVNDREGQLSGDDLDISKLSGDEWALENLAGCDGRLFKIIAKLGRLNLLSQNKPVTERAPKESPAAKTQPFAPKCQDFYSMNNYNCFDGNGWCAMTADQPAEADGRDQFWTEWNEIRNNLRGWSLDDSVLTPVSATSTNLPGDRRDLLHISESFRFSALLYTERLAYPHLPSVHPNFQTLVNEALFHISHVKSDVFLLWPLFITGTECVSEEGRYLIRERCLDIQKDSGFFNNISGLELLEQVWREDDDQVANDESMALTGLAPYEFSTTGGHGFKWRKAMERVDGEYLVV